LGLNNLYACIAYERLQPAPIRFKMDILIVDDMPDKLRVLSAILTKEGYQVRRAVSGKLAMLCDRGYLTLFSRQNQWVVVLAWDYPVELPIHQPVP